MSLSIDTKIQKWGNGLGLRVSGPMRDIPHFSENTNVTVEVFEDGFIVKKAKPANSPLPYSEEALLAELDQHTAHDDLLANPSSDEWPE